MRNKSNGDNVNEMKKRAAVRFRVAALASGAAPLPKLISHMPVLPLVFALAECLVPTEPAGAA